MFLEFATLAAAMGIVLEKSARFKVALAERTIGGRKRDMASDLAAKVASYNCNVSESSKAAESEHTAMAAYLYGGCS